MNWQSEKMVKKVGAMLAVFAVFSTIRPDGFEDVV
jgi:hypothetical protein